MLIQSFFNVKVHLEKAEFNRSLLITLMAGCACFFLEDIIGVLIKMLSIVHNLNKATHILGLQLNF